MKKIFLIVVSFVAFGSVTAFAQKKDANPKTWEEAQSRQIVPEVRTFVTPQICDMKMLSNTRETYGPYQFEIKSIDQTFNFELWNYQNRALYRACKESDADAIIEPLFNSYVYDKDSKTLIVEVSGYPVQYVNFRPATKGEVEMIGVVYPQASTSVQVNTEGSAPDKSAPAKTK